MNHAQNSTRRSSRHPMNESQKPSQTTVDFCDIIEWYQSHCDDSWEHRFTLLTSASFAPCPQRQRPRTSVSISRQTARTAPIIATSTNNQKHSKNFTTQSKPLLAPALRQFAIAAQTHTSYTASPRPDTLTFAMHSNFQNNEPHSK